MVITRSRTLATNQSSCSMVPDEKTTRILSIDGGVGIRGLVAGEALIHLEDSIRSKIANPDAYITDYFDLVAGTGVGGILAALISVADSESGRPVFSARAAVEFLYDNLSRIFRPAGIFRRWNCKYSSSSFESLLRDALRRKEDGRALMLRDTCKHVLIPCYDLNTSAPFVFSTAGACSNSFDFEMWRVCRATSATPGLFKPCIISSADRKTTCVAVDGGLVMNNPSATAVTHVLHNKRDFPNVYGVEDLTLLSIGNGGMSPEYLRQKKQYSGCMGWKADAVDIVADGVSGIVDQMMSNAFSWNPTNYVRIQANGVTTEEQEIPAPTTTETVRQAGKRMLRQQSVETLPLGGKRLMTQSNGERIERFVERLVMLSDGGDLPPSPVKVAGDGAVANQTTAIH